MRKLVLPAGQDLVHITLVPSVEDDRIARGVEDPMQRKCQLDDSEVGSEVAAGLAHLFDQERADLQAQLLQLIRRQVPAGLVGYGSSSTVRSGRLTWA